MIDSTLFSGVRFGKLDEEQTPYFGGNLKGDCSYDVYANDQSNC
jgi:hypothetical protein